MGTQGLQHLVSSQTGTPETWRQEFTPAVSALPAYPRAALLGLPCGQCKAYFAADLEVCPICGCKQRVPWRKTRLPLCNENLSERQAQTASLLSAADRTASSYEEDL